MTIVIFSSVFNHHSLPLCDSLNGIPDVKCYFVETMEEEEQRKNLGYHPYQRDYVINMLSSDENKEYARNLALSADVMIASVFPYELLKKRLKENKLTFLCQERMFKGGETFVRKLRAWFYNIRKFAQFKNKPLYFLSMGDGAAKDYHSIGFYKNKSFRWAYFTKFIEYDVESIINSKDRETINLLFVGRFISWKQPEYPLRATKALLSEGYKIHLTYIGTGELEESLKKDAEGFGEHISFLGSMPPERVREYMDKSNIFTFTSTDMEGWGAVVNEAMNSACAIVASSSPGSVLTMLRDGENGLVFAEDDYDDFYKKLSELVKNPALTSRLGKSAYLTIADSYNATLAAERFVACTRKMLAGEPPLNYSEGIMQKI